MTRYPGILLSIATLALAACGGGKPPGPPVQPAIPSASSAPSDSAAATDAPATSAVYGDDQLPVTGEVLGTVIHTQDADELQYIVLQKLTDRYAVEKGIDVTDAEKAAYIAHMRAALSKDPNFTGLLPGSEESAEDKAAREEISASFIRQWKINRASSSRAGRNRWTPIASSLTRARLGATSGSRIRTWTRASGATIATNQFTSSSSLAARKKRRHSRIRHGLPISLQRPTWFHVG